MEKVFKMLSCMFLALKLGYEWPSSQPGRGLTAVSLLTWSNEVMVKTRDLSNQMGPSVISRVEAAALEHF